MTKSFPQMSDTSFDPHQFYRPVNRTALLKLMDRADAARLQVIKRTRHPKRVPAWLRDRALFDRVIANRPYAKAKLVKWLQIIYLYYICDWRAKDVAEELGLTVSAVKQCLYRMGQNVTNSEDI